MQLTGLGLVWAWLLQSEPGLARPCSVFVSADEQDEYRYINATVTARASRACWCKLQMCPTSDTGEMNSTVHAAECAARLPLGFTPSRDVRDTQRGTLFISRAPIKRPVRYKQ